MRLKKVHSRMQLGGCMQRCSDVFIGSIEGAFLLNVMSALIPPAAEGFNSQLRSFTALV